MIHWKNLKRLFIKNWKESLIQTKLNACKRSTNIFIKNFNKQCPRSRKSRIEITMQSYSRGSRENCKKLRLNIINQCSSWREIKMMKWWKKYWKIKCNCKLGQLMIWISQVCIIFIYGCFFVRYFCSVRWIRETKIREPAKAVEKSSAWIFEELRKYWQELSLK